MDKFLEIKNLHEEIDNLNRPITSTEIGADGFTGEFYQISRKELMPVLLTLPVI